MDKRPHGKQLSCNVPRIFAHGVNIAALLRRKISILHNADATRAKMAGFGVPSFVSKWRAPRPMKMGTIVSLWRYECVDRASAATG
jgi:hypothetical protein